MPGRHILIADPDPETARLLAPPLRQRGHTVAATKSGARALELCISRPPDLVLFDLQSPLLDSETFRQILRANPRTEPVPILVTGREEDRAPPALSEGFLHKPFNVDEVLARIDQLFRRAEVAQRARRSDQGMDGTLGQLSLVDLLQVLGQSRKTGELRLSGPRGSAWIRIDRGEIASARAEGARGAKAFFRLLSWRDGSFSFAPGLSSEAAAELRDIDKPVEELLLEGLRQSDEIAGLREQLPDASARLGLVDRAEDLLGAQHPVAAEILELARAGSTVGEIIERSRATDFSAAHTLLSLVQRGLVTVAPGDLSARAVPKPLLGQGAAHALRMALLQGRPDGSRPRGKLILSAAEPGALAAFLERVAGLPGCSLALEEVRRPTAFASGFGTVGRLDLFDDLALDLVQLPGDEAARPLWLPFSARAIGALAVAAGPAGPVSRGLLFFLCRELGLPVILSGTAQVPAEVADLEPALTASAVEPQEALRALLQRAAERRRGAPSFGLPTM